MAGVITAQRSVTSADGFSVQPTTKLDGDQRIRANFFHTAPARTGAGMKELLNNGEYHAG